VVPLWDWTTIQGSTQRNREVLSQTGEEGSQGSPWGDSGRIEKPEQWTEKTIKGRLGEGGTFNTNEPLFLKCEIKVPQRGRSSGNTKKAHHQRRHHCSELEGRDDKTQTGSGGVLGSAASVKKIPRKKERTSLQHLFLYKRNA